MSYQKEGSMTLKQAFKTVANYGLSIAALATCVAVALPPLSLPVPTPVVAVFGVGLAAFALDAVFNRGRLLVDVPLKEAAQVIRSDLKARFF